MLFFSVNKYFIIRWRYNEGEYVAGQIVWISLSLYVLHYVQFVFNSSCFYNKPDCRKKDCVDLIWLILFSRKAKKTNWLILCIYFMSSLISRSFFHFIRVDALNLSQWLPDEMIICPNWAIMRLVNLIWSQSQINPHDRMHMSVSACGLAWACTYWACLCGDALCACQDF